MIRFSIFKFISNPPICAMDIDTHTNAAFILFLVSYQDHNDIFIITITASIIKYIGLKCFHRRCLSFVGTKKTDGGSYQILIGWFKLAVSKLFYP